MRAEREKRAIILTAEGKKQAAITESQGLKESQILKAEGEAETIKQVAQAEAKRVELVYYALKNANIDETMLSVKYVETLNEMAKGDNKVFIPYELQGLLGSIGSIKELISDKK